MEKRREFSKPRKKDEAMFWGDSRDLKHYLVSKRGALLEILNNKDDSISAEQHDKVKKYIEMIDDMLDECVLYFKECYSMDDMIKQIKLERYDLKNVMSRLEKELENAKSDVEDIFKREGSYVANKYEDAYNSFGQQALRNAIAEYEAIYFEYGEYKKELKVLWWMLGVIHRPVSFFEKVLEV